MKDNNSLAHTSWNCKYHIVFAPKYRREVIYGKLKVDIGKILKMLCERKGVEILAAECCPDNMYMLVSIPPKYRVAEIVGYFKGKQGYSGEVFTEKWCRRGYLFRQGYC